jgi:hypothetical protein
MLGDQIEHRLRLRLSRIATRTGDQANLIAAKLHAT